jgi:DNA-binding NarL/FixJ family response regulator
LTDIVVDAFIEKLENEPVDAYDLLSRREREVINLVAHGHTNTEIADSLFLSRRTVETHRANAMSKLNLENQTDLLRFALSKGLISSDTN